jgi:hypothetical protein
VSTCFVPCSPPPRRHSGPAPVSARRRRSRDADQAAALARVNPRASQARPTPHHPFPSGSMQAGDHAARGPRRHVDPLRPTGGGPPHRATPGSSAARTARRQRRGHRSVSVRTPGWHWTPDAWTLDVRSTGWTDVPTTGPGMRTGQRPAWPASGHLATGDTRWAARPRPRSRRLGALGHPRRLRGDGTRAAALTAAATGQLPSTARHEAAPRRTALLRRSGSRVLRRAMRQRRVRQPVPGAVI